MQVQIIPKRNHNAVRLAVNSLHPLTTNMSTVLVSALPPDATCREEAVRLVTGILEQEGDDAMRRHVLRGESADGGPVVAMCPQILEIFKESLSRLWQTI